MNYVKIRELITAKELHNLLPLDSENGKIIANHRQEIKRILSGEDKRLLLLVGPCSAWPQQAVLDYAILLRELSQKVQKSIKIVMRVYPQKPRTILGWGGASLQPDPFANTDINQGLMYSRKMMLDVIDLGLPIAAEILYTNMHNYYIDLISWVAIGARSSENQEHRIFASSLDIPTGIKNPTHGSLNIAVNSIIAAQNPHTSIIDNFQAHTFGNPYAHLVLRGGNNQPNYANQNLLFIDNLFQVHKIKNPSVIIDVNHDNSIVNKIKDYTSQPSNVLNIINNIKNIPNLKKLVKGFMVESFIHEGKQSINLVNSNQTNLQGLSVTDPCISWEKTEELILKLHHSTNIL